jgi:hypothetical protein
MKRANNIIKIPSMIFRFFFLFDGWWQCILSCFSCLCTEKKQVKQQYIKSVRLCSFHHFLQTFTFLLTCCRSLTKDTIIITGIVAVLYFLYFFNWSYNVLFFRYFVLYFSKKWRFFWQNLYIIKKRLGIAATIVNNVYKKMHRW